MNSFEKEYKFFCHNDKNNICCQNLIEIEKGYLMCSACSLNLLCQVRVPMSIYKTCVAFSFIYICILKNNHRYTMCPSKT